MLVICNGAAKCGSTWLYNILTNIVDFSWPDQKFLTNTNKKHPTIREDHLVPYLRNGEHRTRSVISKSHLGKPRHREVLLSDRDVKIVCMTRDARDCIVSSYYDSRKRHGHNGSFEAYYWETGRLQIEVLASYKALWSEPHERVFMTTFESLKTNFSEEVVRLGSFLDRELTPSKVAQIYQTTNLQSLRSSYSDASQYTDPQNPFFRKGVIGDWRNHFDPKTQADFERVSQRGIGPFDHHVLRARLQRKVTKLFR